jgi:hypothetical protein
VLTSQKGDNFSPVSAARRYLHCLEILHVYEYESVLFVPEVVYSAASPVQFLNNLETLYIHRNVNHKMYL